MEPLSTLAPIVGQVGGGLGLLVLVAWFIWQQHAKTQNDMSTQTDSAAVALIREGREDRRELRDALEADRERHADEMKALRDELGATRERVAVVEQRNRDWLSILQVHAAWDMAALDLNRRMAAHLRDCGTGEHMIADYSLGPAPALYPPHGPLATADRPPTDRL